MYSRFQLAKKYLHYFMHASNGKGYGVHSPFVYDFIIHVLNGKNRSPLAGQIENYRTRLLRNGRKVEVEDFGAGSAVRNTRERRVSDIAHSALKNKKYAGLLYRIASYYHCRNIVELGTSLGVTTAYLASAAQAGKVISLEGADRIADIAEDFLESTGLQNTQIIRGDFEKTIPQLIARLPAQDLVFIDGNHHEEPTCRYFENLLQRTHNDSILIFDDIHWSTGMERAWERIKNHPSVRLSIDLFFVGLIFFKEEFLVKRDFSIRY